MTSLPDAERDANEVVQLLAGFAELLRRREFVLDDDTQAMLGLALEGGVSAARVLEYLRALQGSGDGVAVAVAGAARALAALGAAAGRPVRRDGSARPGSRRCRAPGAAVIPASRAGGLLRRVP
nr:hypothetical protein GCM10020092_014810 [Actinoplanes digitatis]